MLFKLLSLVQEHSQYPQKETPIPMSNQTSVPTPCTLCKPKIRFLSSKSLWIYLFWTFRIRAITQCVSFSACLSPDHRVFEVRPHCSLEPPETGRVGKDPPLEP